MQIAKNHIISLNPFNDTSSGNLNQEVTFLNHAQTKDILTHIRHVCWFYSKKNETQRAKCLSNKSKLKSYMFSMITPLKKLLRCEKLFDYRTRKCNRRKELSLCHKLKFCNPYILATWWCKPLIFDLPEFIVWNI